MPTCIKSERAKSKESWYKCRLEDTEDSNLFTKHMGFLEFAFFFDQDKKNFFGAIGDFKATCRRDLSEKLII
jgi:hypothetical protein